MKNRRISLQTTGTQGINCTINLLNLKKGESRESKSNLLNLKKGESRESKS
jgi:hypothetical protein